MRATDATTTGLDADLALIRDAAREAGAIAMRYFRKDPEVWMKGGTSPVSAADLEVDRFLHDVLRGARPDYGWLSEETADSPERLSARRTFVVDPIDGTRAFIEGKRTWCISIAVVEDGRSLVGVLDCPAKQEIFEATRNGEALKNGTAIRVAPVPAHPRIAGPKPMVMSAPPHLRSGEAVPYIPSLAYRLAMIANGEIDGTFVKASAHDWDLAAADLILRRAGGGILNETGEAPAYGGPQPRHGVLVAAGCDLLPELARLIASPSQ